MSFDITLNMILKIIEIFHMPSSFLAHFFILIICFLRSVSIYKIYFKIVYLMVGLKYSNVL